jgi:ergothioneine biosynthesis protein EgtB
VALVPTRDESDATSVARPVKEPPQTRNDLGPRYFAIRKTTERLAAPLAPEDCQVQSMPDASPAKWHLAHTSWFFETFLLVPNLAGYKVFHPSFNYLFNSYYNAVGARLARTDRGLITRPTLEEVYAYRRAVDQAIGDYLEVVRQAPPAQIAGVIELGVNHEQQHQELILTDIKHALAQNPMRPAYRAGVAGWAAGPAPPLEWRPFAGGLKWIGHDGREAFAFDNEGPRHRAYLEPFLLGSRLVTNGEFLAFIADGGYRRPELWLSDGWNAASARRWQAPLYWERFEDAWSVFTLGGFWRIAEAEPVCHVSYYEADAFARWAGARLPTEAEWESAAGSLKPDGNLLETGEFHPRPAEHGTGVAQCFGDTWEWTQSPYTPYPGLKPAAGALGEYNAKFMCNQLVLRGGSCATPATHIRASYRNFFPPESRWQFTGIRLAKNA